MAGLRGLCVATIAFVIAKDIAMAAEPLTLAVSGTTTSADPAIPVLVALSLTNNTEHPIQVMPVGEGVIMLVQWSWTAPGGHRYTMSELDLHCGIPNPLAPMKVTLDGKQTRTWYHAVMTPAAFPPDESWTLAATVFNVADGCDRLSANVNFVPSGRTPPPFVDEVGFTLSQAVLLPHTWDSSLDELEKKSGIAKARQSACNTDPHGVLVMFAASLHEREGIRQCWQRIDKCGDAAIAMRHYMLLGALNQRIQHRSIPDLARPLLTDEDRKLVDESLKTYDLFSKELAAAWDQEARLVREYQKSRAK